MNHATRIIALTGLTATLVIAPASAASLDELLAEAKTYEYGQSREVLTQIGDQVRAALGDADRSRAIEKKLAAVLATDATFDCKLFVGRQLAIIGTDQSVPALARLLGDEKLAHVAILALQVNRDRSAAAALRDALATVRGKTLYGVINTIGARRDRQAVEVLGRLAGGADAAAKAEAIRALGKIGGPGALRQLRALPDQTSPAVANALLRCAYDALAAKRNADAWAICERIYDGDGYPIASRVAALRGLLEADTDRAVPILTAAMGGKIPKLQEAARRFLRELRGRSMTEAVAARLDSLDPQGQAQLLAALADRGDAAALATVEKATRSVDRGVRVAALAALGALGDASTVDRLAEVAATGGVREARTARGALDKLGGTGVDEAIIKQLLAAHGRLRVELIRSAGAREIGAALPVLLEVAGGAAGDARLEAIKALASLAGEPELARLVRLLVATGNGTERQALEEAVTVACARVARPDHCAEIVASPLSGAGADARGALVRILGKIGGDKALDAVESLLEDKAVGVDAALAAVQIARGIIAADRDRAEALVKKVQQSTDDATVRKQAADVLDYIRRFESFVTAWELAGPYRQRRRGDAGALFDRAFPPERADRDDDVKWRPITAQPGRHPVPFVDLTKAIGGNNRVAYLRARVFVPETQEAQLEIGSDDGVKVWIGGKVVHANNATRGLTPGSDKLEVTLEKGWNPLLVKVTQASGEWEVCVRIRTVDGGKIDGLKTAVK